MLELAKALAVCDESFYGGWIMAGVEVHIKGKAVHYNNKLLLNKKSKSIFEVKGTTAFGTETKSLRVFLVMPQPGTAVPNQEAEFPGKLALKHVFAKAEVDEYVAYTGDENIVHKGPKPLVPGLCMAAYLQQAFGLEQLDWRIAFKSPVYADEELVVYTKEGHITAFVGERVAFVIKKLIFIN